MSAARTRGSERGSVTPFVVIVGLAIILLAALVIDGGRQLNAHGRAVAYAQEAARAGAQEVNVADPRLDLDRGLALKAARQYCGQAMSADPELTRCTPSLVTVSGTAGTFHGVRVSAEVQENSILLGIIGKPELDASGEAVARPVSGISQPDSGKLQTAPPPSVGVPGGGPVPTAPVQPPGISISPCTTKKPKPSKKPGKKHSKKPHPTKGPSQCVVPHG